MAEYSLLGGLSDDARRRVLAAARRRKFARNEVVFHEGDPGDALHLVAKGRIAIRITTPMGETATVRVVQQGEFFGELALLSPGPRSATVVALEPSETLVLHRDQLEDLRATAPQTTEVLLTALSMEVRRLATALVEALYLPAEVRLWRRIHEVAESYGNDGGEVIVPLTQEELAQLAGITRPTANRLLRQGEEAGAVALTRGRLTITDRAWVAKRAR